MKTLKEISANSTLAIAFIKSRFPTMGYSPIVEAIKHTNTPSTIFVPSGSAQWFQKVFEGVSFEETESDSIRTIAEEVSKIYNKVIVIDSASSDSLFEDFEFVGVKLDTSNTVDIAVKNKNFNKFYSLYEGVMSDSDIRKMWVQVSPPTNYKTFIAETSELRERFFSGEYFKIGSYVTENNDTFEIVDRGSNYLVVVDSVGNTFRKFPKSVTESKNPPKYQDFSYFKGFIPSDAFFANPEIVESFNQTIQQYSEGLINDPFAILKSIKMVDSLLKEEKVDVTQLKYSLSKIGQLNEHSSYLSEIVDKSLATQLQAARIIAGAIGSDTKGTNPTDIVNTAIKAAKKKSNPAQMKILQNMLDTASKVGVKYDSTLLESVDDRMVAIHKHQTLLKEKPTKDVLSDHQNMRKLGVKYEARDVGGKRAMIGDILSHHYGPREVSSYKALKAHVRRSLGEEQIEEISDTLAKSYSSKAMHDTISGKKDRNPGMKMAYARLSGTNKPLLDPKKKYLGKDVNEVHEDPDYDTEREILGYDNLKKKLAKMTGIQNYGEQEPGKSIDLIDKNGTVVKPDHHTRPGFSLNHSSETVRKMKVRKLRDE